jgi:GT2 family glycosyltransferase
LNQTYKNVEVLIVDNGSTDNTLKIISKFVSHSYIGIELIKNKKNLGFAQGHNIGIEKSRGEFIVCLNQDLILDKDFIKEIVKTFEKNPKIGSVQAKIYQLNKGDPSRLAEARRREAGKTKIIDTIGSIIFKTGEINDQGQGEKDNRQYDSLSEVFAVNGVAPGYRRKALNDVKLKNEYFDKNFFSYAEDVDLAWRMRWKGWLAKFNPKAIAWHDRTSSKIATGGWSVFRRIRKSQSFWIRKMGYRNQWLLFIKNQSFAIALKFLFWFKLRQVKLFFYLLFFEPSVLILSILELIPLIPKMLIKRRIIMKNRRISNKEMSKWFR